MTLLREIQDAAIGTEVPVAVLLRKCLVLAARLQHEPLREWVQLELNGYPDDAELPPYRPVVNTTVKGNLSGFGGSSMSNVPLAQGNVPEDWRESLFSVEIRQGVAQLEEFAAAGEATLYLPWPQDVVAVLQDKFMEGMNLMSANRIIPGTVFAATLSGIRDRVLQFALEIEGLDPSAGEAEPDGNPVIERSRVTQVFNQTFYGDNTAVAAAGHTVRQTQHATSLTTLSQTLAALGIAEPDIDALLDAVKEEGVLDGKPAGEKTRDWIQRLETGAIAVGAGIATETAVTAVSALLGL